MYTRRYYDISYPEGTWIQRNPFKIMGNGPERVRSHPQTKNGLSEAGYD